MSGARVLPGWLRPLAERLPTVTADDLRWHDDRRAPAGAARPAAVLVLFADGPAGPEVLLTERAGTLRQHSGQVAFPGGRSDPGDPSPAATALREAAEETGLDPAGVDVLGELPRLLLAHSRHSVTPVVAHWRAPAPVGVRDAAEVARVERVPLPELLAPAARRRLRGPGGYAGPAFAVRGMLVWGFTAEVLVRVLALGDLLPVDGAVGGPGAAELTLDEALRWARGAGTP
ncbi:CoA pyrophosphatase [Paenibacillus sp. TRM 82003]|uniref:NUDIX hydrolase n=1 Tax=Kineococcus sp. TRM81007 TaxID=2925831 RepID=UPI001F58B0DA|nr:CoA pyrophosphatase [Kineococcus sp. TRM81007]MCI2239550.1 CoA pyrophosphatase [Kineococcus sp. TRM81007]MCI3926168.1 CoA pyrophosphatase [Paenibacillus sp. TRM 82003]